jgi:hypothetical protein
MSNLAAKAFQAQCLIIRRYNSAPLPRLVVTTCSTFVSGIAAYVQCKIRDRLCVVFYGILKYGRTGKT